MIMLTSMVRFPELPEARFSAEREVILREAERGADNPSLQVYEKFMQTMFPQHPLRHPVIGYQEMIAEVTRETALKYHAERYTPDRCIVVAVGDLDEKEFFEFYFVNLFHFAGHACIICLRGNSPSERTCRFSGKNHCDSTGRC